MTPAAALGDHVPMDNTPSALEGVQVPHNTVPVPPGRHRDVAEPIAVRARLVWDSGEEWIDARALEWTRELVRVETRDHRLMPRVVWVQASDVRRR